MNSIKPSVRKYSYEDSLLKKGILLLLFASFIIVGFCIAGDYGVPWDDHLQIKITKFNLDFIIGNNQNISEMPGNMFGTAFELPLYLFQQLFDSYSAQVYVRHLVTHLYFLFSLFVFFKLLFVLFESFNLALLGVIFLYFNPILFANSFFNTKDIPFLSTFIISIYTLYLFLKNEDKKSMLLHAFITAFLIDIRVSGLLIPVITIISVVINQLINTSYRVYLRKLLMYLLFSAVFIVLFWPALWKDPFMLFHAVIHMTNYPSAVLNLFNGELILSSQNPWYYIPVWIAISTPFLLLLFYAIGLFKMTKDFLVSQYTLSPTSIIAIIFVFLPLDILLLIIIIEPTFYDTWRHLYFLFPLIIIGSIYGLRLILDYIPTVKYRTFIIYGFILFYSVFMGIRIIDLHPYQQVFLNSLVSKTDNNTRQNWEMDYWGLSYKEGFEKLLETDKSDSIKVHVLNVSAFDNWRLVSENDSRIVLVDSISKADYFISNYRFHPLEYNYEKTDSICRQGSCILSIYLLK